MANPNFATVLSSESSLGMLHFFPYIARPKDFSMSRKCYLLRNAQRTALLLCKWPQRRA